MILKKIEEIEKQMAEAEREKTALEGRIALLLEQLQGEFGTQNLNEAKFLLNDLQDKIVEKEKGLKEAVSRLEAETKPFLNGV
jgi:hypothetical protein